MATLHSFFLSLSIGHFIPHSVQPPFPLRLLPSSVTARSTCALPTDVLPMISFPCLTSHSSLSVLGLCHVVVAAAAADDDDANLTVDFNCVSLPNHFCITASNADCWLIRIVIRHDTNQHDIVCQQNEIIIVMNQTVSLNDLLLYITTVTLQDHLPSSHSLEVRPKYRYWGSSGAL